MKKWFQHFPNPLEHNFKSVLFSLLNLIQSLLHSSYHTETAFANITNDHVVTLHDHFPACIYLPRVQHLTLELHPPSDKIYFLHIGYQSMSWFFFDLMAWSFLTFQLIFLILEAVKVIVFLGYVLKQLLHPYWLIWGSYVISSKHNELTASIHCQFLIFVSSLNLSLSSRLKYSTTFLTSKCGYLINISKLTCQQWNSWYHILPHSPLLLLLLIQSSPC